MDFVGRSVSIVDCPHACVQDHHSDAFLHEASQRHFRLTCEAVKVWRDQCLDTMNFYQFPDFMIYGNEPLARFFQNCAFLWVPLSLSISQPKLPMKKHPREIHAISGAMTQTRLCMSVLWWDRKKDHGPRSCIPGRKKDERRIWSEKHFDSLKNLRNHVTKRPQWLSLPWHGASVTITTSFSCAVHGK